MIRVDLKSGEKLALAFYHPEYTAKHTTKETNGEGVVEQVVKERKSRKTVVEVHRILENGQFVCAGRAEVKTHYSDHFNRAKGRYLALKRLLEVGKTAFNRDTRTAIWAAYWNRANGVHIEPPKTPPMPITAAGFPIPGAIMKPTHTVINRQIFN